MKASEFEKKFDDNESVLNDREARRLSVTRQSVIKMWLDEWMQQRV